MKPMPDQTELPSDTGHGVTYDLLHDLLMYEDQQRGDVVTFDQIDLRRDIRDTLISHLRTLEDRQRGDVLAFCAKTTLFTVPILSAKTLDAIAEHIIEICEEWRWL
jgi:hypothetical protein